MDMPILLLYNVKTKPGQILFHFFKKVPKTYYLIDVGVIL